MAGPMGPFTMRWALTLFSSHYATSRSPWLLPSPVRPSQSHGRCAAARRPAEAPTVAAYPSTAALRSGLARASCCLSGRSSPSPLGAWPSSGNGAAAQAQRVLAFRQGRPPAPAQAPAPARPGRSTGARRWPAAQAPGAADLQPAPREVTISNFPFPLCNFPLLLNISSLNYMYLLFVLL